MKAKTCLALAIAAGCATVASANPENITIIGQQGLTTDVIGHIYYNVATGEMVKTPAANTRGEPDPLWVNEIYDQCEFAEWFYYASLNTGNGTNNYWMDWAEATPDAIADTMTLLFVTDVPDPEADGEEGLEADFTFFSGIDQGSVDSTVGTGDFVMTITGLPGSDASGGGLGTWLITLDLAGGNEVPFGNTDIDGDEMTNFGYGWNFRVPETAVANVVGMGLVSPPEGTDENSMGDPDNMGLSFDQNWTTTNPNYWFGGYDCSGGAGFNWSPFASWYLGFYSAGDAPGGCNDADLVEPFGVLEFADVLAFLGAFSAMEPAADLVPAGGDGVWEFADVLYFLGEFSAGCP